VFEPILANSDVMEFLIASIAVRIPTRAIIPKAMMNIVRIALTIFDRIDFVLILKFSCSNPKNLIVYEKIASNYTI